MILSDRLSRLMRATSCILLFQSAFTDAIAFNPNSDSSIRSATKSITKDIFSIYTGDEPGGIPGILPGIGQPDGYYWWIGGGLFGTMINYWHHTGDTTYVEATRQAIALQSSPSTGGYFESLNWTLQLGNDDISFWANAALMAAEYNFPDPPSYASSWLTMVQGAWNRQAYRWDNKCGGGLRWQIANIQGTGWYYKNSISNGCFFQIGARLAKYTGNQSYAHWAEKTWNWTEQVGLIDADYNVYDGIEVDDCSMKGHTDQWSYNVGVYLYGAAVMYNMTGADIWATRTTGLLKAAGTFFKDDVNGNPVLTEIICEPEGTCQIDQSTFKAYLARWMRASTEVATDLTLDTVNQMLKYSAPAAAQVCTGSDDVGGTACGEQWYVSEFDGKTGVGEDMNALEVMQTLIPASGPLTLQTGAKSKGNPAAGNAGDLGGGVEGTTIQKVDVTTADKAGAAILTILLVGGSLGGAWWIVK